MKQVNHVTGWRRFGLWCLASILKLWNASLRIHCDEDSRAAFAKRRDGKPLVLLAWHNRLFVISTIFLKFRKGVPTHVLVSASKDGALLAGFCEMIGLVPVRGSSTFRSKEALRELEQSIANGFDVGITPDGPRGPKYRIKNGAVHLSTKFSTDVLLVSADYHKEYVCKSWDDFKIPFPFSRVDVRAKYCELDFSLSLPEQRRILNEQLLALAGEQ